MKELRRPRGRHHRRRLGHRPGPGPATWPAAAPTSPCPTSTRSGWPRPSALCEGSGVKVTSQRLDVADRDAVYAWADQVVADHGKVNLIFNNAGVALGATIEAMSYEDFEWLMNINFWGVVLRHQGLPAPPEGVRRGPHRQPVERVRAHQRPVAVGLQRGQVRRARLHRRAAHGARDREVRRLVPRPSTRAASRPTSPATPAWTRASSRWPATAEAAAEASNGCPDQPGEGGPPDPHRRRARSTPGPDRARRQGDRPHLAAAGKVVSVRARGRHPATAGSGRQP